MEIPITEYLNIRYLIKNKEEKIIYPTNKNEINYIKRILKCEHIDEEIYDNKNKRWYSYIIKNEIIDGNDYQIEIIIDITKHKKYATDYTTNLYNKETIFNKLKEIISSYSLYTIIIADIDFFKKANDTYGHIAGDKILNTIGSIIKKDLNNNCFAGRFGGEEFLIVIKNENFKKIYKIIEKIRKDIHKIDFKFEKQHINNITMSFGIYHNDNINLNDYKSINELLNYVLSVADNELYKSKENGRNQINYYIEKSV